MKQIWYFLLSFLLCPLSVVASSTITNTSNFTNTNSYSTMYPYMSNNMRQKLNPNTTPGQASKAISTLVKTSETTNARSATTASNTQKSTRKVVARSTKKKTSNANTARAATQTATNYSPSSVRTNTTTTRKVTSRPRTSSVRSTIRSTSSNSVVSTSGTAVTSQRCLADYINCMEGYCKREEAAYNRCYCSAKLAQIDEKYKNNIDSLIQSMIQLQGTNNWTDEEMNEYWESTVGQYTNSWTKLEEALNIDWSSTESRVRGQNAFNIGHEYCSQHLSNCFYMASNMKDVYKSEIARDCSTYEKSLQTMQSIIESIIESYND